MFNYAVQITFAEYDDRDCPHTRKNIVEGTECMSYTLATEFRNDLDRLTADSEVGHDVIHLPTMRLVRDLQPWALNYPCPIELSADEIPF